MVERSAVNRVVAGSSPASAGIMNTTDSLIQHYVDDLVDSMNERLSETVFGKPSIVYELVRITDDPEGDHDL